MTLDSLNKKIKKYIIEKMKFIYIFPKRHKIRKSINLIQFVQNSSENWFVNNNQQLKNEGENCTVTCT